MTKDDSKTSVVASDLWISVKRRVVLSRIAANMQQTLTTEGLAQFEGSYTYGNSLPWAKRNDHDPWTWWHNVNTETYPHFTAHFASFSGNPAELQNFHITYPYLGFKHKPVHIHYAIVGEKVVRGAFDFKRTGDVLAARKAFFAIEENYNALAQAFLDRVFN